MDVLIIKPPLYVRIYINEKTCSDVKYNKKLLDFFSFSKKQVLF